MKLNLSIIKEKILKYWPLWVTVSVIGSLFPISFWINRANGRTTFIKNELDLIEFYCEYTRFGGPIYAFCATMFVMALCFGYLYKSRSVGFMHSIPVKRESLFISNFLAGLSMMTIPYLVTGLFCILASLYFGIFTLPIVLKTFLRLLGYNFVFCSIGTLCSVLCGTFANAVLCYLYINFGTSILGWLIANLADGYLYGITSNIWDGFIYTSPLVGILDKTTYSNFKCLIWYVIVAALLCVLTIFLYKNRESERSGDAIAFPILNKGFIAIACVNSAFMVGFGLYGIFAVMFDYDRGFSTIPLIIFMSIGGTLGLFWSRMVITRSKRVFKRSLKQIISIVLFCVLLCLSFDLDILKLENRVPKNENIDSINYFMGGGTINITNQDTKEIEEMRSMHQKVLDNRTELEARRDEENPYDKYNYTNVNITYILKNGTTVVRDYPIYIDESKANETNTVDNAIYSIYNNPKLLVRSYDLEGDLNGRFECTIYRYDTKLETEEERDILLTSKESTELLEALRNDMLLGRVDHFSVYDDAKYEVSIESLDGRIFHWIAVNENMVETYNKIATF